MDPNTGETKTKGATGKGIKNDTDNGNGENNNK